jgi:hypothetical protein
MEMFFTEPASSKLYLAALIDVKNYWNSGKQLLADLGH